MERPPGEHVDLIADTVRRGKRSFYPRDLLVRRVAEAFHAHGSRRYSAEDDGAYTDALLLFLRIVCYKHKAAWPTDRTARLALIPAEYRHPKR
jgi:hypothetical protein